MFKGKMTKLATFICAVLSVLCIGVGLAFGTSTAKTTTVQAENITSSTASVLGRAITSFTMDTGASIRIGSDADPHTGIKFDASISKADYDFLASKLDGLTYSRMEFGIVIAPSSYYLEYNDIFNSSTWKYRWRLYDKENECWSDEYFNGDHPEYKVIINLYNQDLTPTYDGSGNVSGYKFTGCAITNIKDTNLLTTFKARAYVFLEKCGEHTGEDPDVIWATSNDNVRSAYQLASVYVTDPATYGITSNNAAWLTSAYINKSTVTSKTNIVISDIYNADTLDLSKYIPKLSYSYTVTNSSDTDVTASVSISNYVATISSLDNGVYTVHANFTGANRGYTVTFEKFIVDSSLISVDKTNADLNDEITVSTDTSGGVTPTISVTDPDGSAVSVTDNKFTVTKAGGYNIVVTYTTAAGRTVSFDLTTLVDNATVPSNYLETWDYATAPKTNKGYAYVNKKSTGKADDTWYDSLDGHYGVLKVLPSPSSLLDFYVKSSRTAEEIKSASWSAIEIVWKPVANEWFTGYPFITNSTSHFTSQSTANWTPGWQTVVIERSWIADEDAFAAGFDKDSSTGLKLISGWFYDGIYIDSIRFINTSFTDFDDASTLSMINHDDKEWLESYAGRTGVVRYSQNSWRYLTLKSDLTAEELELLDWDYIEFCIYGEYVYSSNNIWANSSNLNGELLFGTSKTWNTVRLTKAMIVSTGITLSQLYSQLAAGTFNSIYVANYGSQDIYLDYIKLGGTDTEIDFDSSFEKQFIRVGETEYLDEYEGRTGVVRAKPTGNSEGLRFSFNMTADRARSLDWDYIEFCLYVISDSSSAWGLNFDYNHTVVLGRPYRGAWNVVRITKDQLINASTGVYSSESTFYSFLTGTHGLERIYAWNITDTQQDVYFDYIRFGKDVTVNANIKYIHSDVPTMNVNYTMEGSTPVAEINAVAYDQSPYPYVSSSQTYLLTIMTADDAPAKDTNNALYNYLIFDLYIPEGSSIKLDFYTHCASGSAHGSCNGKGGWHYSSGSGQGIGQTIAQYNTVPYKAVSASAATFDGLTNVALKAGWNRIVSKMTGTDAWGLGFNYYGGYANVKIANVICTNDLADITTNSLATFS